MLIPNSVFIVPSLLKTLMSEHITTAVAFPALVAHTVTPIPVRVPTNENSVHTRELLPSFGSLQKAIPNTAKGRNALVSTPYHPPPGSATSNCTPSREKSQLFWECQQMGKARWPCFSISSCRAK